MARRGVGVVFDVGDVLFDIGALAKWRISVDGEVVDRHFVVEKLAVEDDVFALQNFDAEDDVAKGAVDEDFVVEEFVDEDMAFEEFVVEDKVIEEDEWAKATKTRSGSATSTREGLALGTACYGTE